MKSLISYEEFASRYSQDVLPELKDEGEPKEHVLQAINDATGIIVSHLSWIIDKEINNTGITIYEKWSSNTMAKYKMYRRRFNFSRTVIDKCT